MFIQFVKVRWIYLFRAWFIKRPYEQRVTIILSVVLYECEIWSLKLKEERRLRVLEKRVLRRIFELKRNEVLGEWVKLHVEELNDLYSSPNFFFFFRVNKSRKIR